MALTVRTIVLTIAAMVAFAANSVLARLALGSPMLTDPVGYTVIRLASAALILIVLLALRDKPKAKAKADPLSALMLFGYALAFSLAYLKLETAMGALILFAAVQLTMIGWGLIAGERLSARQWVGVIMSFATFTYLMTPGLGAPDAFGAALMCISGMCWGGYSLKGRGAGDALGRTASNFIWTLPLAALAFGVSYFAKHTAGNLPLRGIVLAVISGALTSGVGYAIWYSALKGLSAVQGGVVQLSVPIIAAIGGVILVSEGLTMRLILSSVLILGGIALTLIKNEETA